MHEWRGILDFWFPEGTSLDVDPRVHREHWTWRMRGGADEAIVAHYTETTERAVAGEFNNWAADPHGRLALIVALDQFPRSVWRNTPRAFAQDEEALALALEGHRNGHYSALETPWYKTVYNLPLGHCEGPDHLERLDLALTLAREILEEAPPHLKPGYAFAAEQPVEVRKVIAAFGRHPHRNAALGRASTPAEQAYIAEGRFPHLRVPPAQG
jgi:uncharacterized protein (DUF924 family)